MSRILKNQEHPNSLDRVWQYDVTNPNQLGRELQYYVTDPNQLGREWQYYVTDNQYSMSSLVYSKNPLYKKYMVSESNPKKSRAP